MADCRITRVEKQFPARRRSLSLDTGQVLETNPSPRSMSEVGQIIPSLGPRNRVASNRPGPQRFRVARPGVRGVKPTPH